MFFGSPEELILFFFLGGGTQYLCVRHKKIVIFISVIYSINPYDIFPFIHLIYFVNNINKPKFLYK